MPDEPDRINRVLDELIGLATEVHQAHRRLADAAGPRDEVGWLAEDLSRWMNLIVELDVAAGNSPLGTVTTPTGRTRQPWLANAGPAELLAALTAQLSELADHVSAARKSADAGPSQAVLDEMLRGIEHHLSMLRGSPWSPQLSGKPVSPGPPQGESPDEGTHTG